MSVPYDDQYQQEWNTSEEAYSHLQQQPKYYSQFPDYYTEYPDDASLNQTSSDLQNGYYGKIYSGEDSDSYDLYHDRAGSSYDKVSNRGSTNSVLQQYYGRCLAALPSLHSIAVSILKVTAAVFAVEMFRVTCYTESCVLTERWSIEYFIPDTIISAILTNMSSSLWRLRYLNDIAMMSAGLVLMYSGIETFHSYSSSLVVLAWHASETFCLFIVMLSAMFAIELMCDTMSSDEAYAELECQPESCAWRVDAALESMRDSEQTDEMTDTQKQAWQELLHAEVELLDWRNDLASTNGFTGYDVKALESSADAQMQRDFQKEAFDEARYTDVTRHAEPTEAPTTQQKQQQLHEQLDVEQKEFRDLHEQKQLLQEAERRNREQLEDQLEVLGRNLMYCNKTRQKKDVMMPHLNKHRAANRSTRVPAVPPPSASASPVVSVADLYFINITDL